MSILDNTADDISSHEHGDFEINEFDSTKPEQYLDPSVGAGERADTGDFPALRPDIPHADASHIATSDEDSPAGRASAPRTVLAPDNHEEHSTLLIAALLPIGCLWIGITVDSLFDSLALTATSVAVFATLTLGVLVASALHDSE